jgi:hypothetical protein
MHPLDRWRAANLLIQQHGAGAAAHAERRSLELALAGDTEGARAWLRILEAIGELQRVERDAAEVVH